MGIEIGILSNVLPPTSMGKACLFTIIGPPITLSTDRFKIPILAGEGKRLSFFRMPDGTKRVTIWGEVVGDLAYVSPSFSQWTPRSCGQRALIMHRRIDDDIENLLEWLYDSGAFSDREGEE